MNALAGGAGPQLNDTAPVIGGVSGGGGTITSADTFTVGSMLSFGTRSRFVSLDYGLSLEVLDGGVWTEVSRWVSNN